MRAIAGTRYTVLGLGILGGGVGVAKYLASHGGIVTVTDLRPKEQLQSSIDLLQGLPITYHLGGHQDEDFTSANADVVIRNPGVRRTSPYLMMARNAGVRIDMEMSLFFQACPAPILGITGTKGKTTVSTLCGEIMHRWRSDALLAGNMGISALAEVDVITVDQPVVIELSSWQLEALDEHGLGPHVALITNISPDHLDAYDGFDDYARTKRTIGHHLAADDVMVYNADDPETAKVAQETNARLLPFSLAEPDGDGAWRAIDELVLRWSGEEYRIPAPTQLALDGRNGTLNALAAFAATMAYGAPIQAVRDGIAGFGGVANRMEAVATIDGVLYVNDTSATAPAAAVHAIDVLASRSRTVHVIAGGADKQTDLEPFADALASHPVAVTLLDGTATPTLQRLLEERDVAYQGPFASLPAAFAAANGAAGSGDTVALVPACASFGMFRNEFDRGDQFRAAVLALKD